MRQYGLNPTEVQNFDNNPYTKARGVARSTGTPFAVSRRPVSKQRVSPLIKHEISDRLLYKVSSLLTYSASRHNSLHVYVGSEECRGPLMISAVAPVIDVQFVV